MLDDVERRAFLVQPARKYPLPAPARLFDVELDERPREPFILPRRGCVARAQAHYGVAEADRLARPQRDIADDAVALVEQPEHRHALAHRGYPRNWLDRLGCVHGHRIGAIDRLVGILRATIAARAKRDQSQQDETRDQDYSGFHA